MNGRGRAGGHHQRTPRHTWHWECQKIGVENHPRFLTLGLTCALRFGGRTDALRWMIDHQLGRRNLRPDQISLLRGQRFELEKQDAHSHPAKAGRPKKEKSGPVSGPDFLNESQGRTAEKLAKEYGVSTNTIKEDGRFAKAAELIEAASSPEVKELLVSKQVARTKSEFIDIAESLDGRGSVEPEVAQLAPRPAARVGETGRPQPSGESGSPEE